MEPQPDATDSSARPRRSSRAVAKPDFRAMENYGDLTSEYGDDVFQGRDLSPMSGQASGHMSGQMSGHMSGQASGQASGHPSRPGGHARRPSGGGTKKAGGQASKGRRPAAMDELEAAAKKLENDVTALQNRSRDVRAQLEAILRENDTLRAEIGGTSAKREDVVYF